mgnify:CR=1 FL=1
MTKFTIDDPRNAIEALFDAHPEVTLETSSNGVHLRVYRTSGDLPIGHEHKHKTMQGIWVRRDSVRLDRMKSLDYRIKSELDRHLATTDLESVDGFAGEPLIYFRIRNLAEFSAIMGEVLG